MHFIVCTCCMFRTYKDFATRLLGGAVVPASPYPFYFLAFLRVSLTSLLRERRTRDIEIAITARPRRRDPRLRPLTARPNRILVPDALHRKERGEPKARRVSRACARVCVTYTHITTDQKIPSDMFAISDFSRWYAVTTFVRSPSEAIPRSRSNASYQIC